MLNLKTKIAILSTYLAGAYTSVAEIAREFSVSRQRVQVIYHQVEECLQRERPGPKGGAAGLRAVLIEIPSVILICVKSNVPTRTGAARLSAYSSDSAS